MPPVAFLTCLLDFSGLYEEEGFAPEGAVRVDLTGLEGTACYCDSEAAARIRERMRDLPVRALHWIDGGDFHYVSRFWLEKLVCPFELVLIDRHSDDQPSAFGPGLLSCGSWVADARRDLSLVRDSHWIRQAPYRPADALFFQPGLPVYLSIDKDVLSPEWARTNWDQGDLSLPQLKELIRQIAACREILGIDVCGGLTVAQGATPHDFAINLRTDTELQDFFVSLRTI